LVLESIVFIPYLKRFSSLNKLMVSPFFSLFRMFSSLTSKAPLDRI
jgi:hypothetical protein